MKNMYEMLGFLTYKGLNPKVVEVQVRNHTEQHIYFYYDNREFVAINGYNGNTRVEEVRLSPLRHVYYADVSCIRAGEKMLEDIKDIAKGIEPYGWFEDGVRVLNPHHPDNKESKT